MTVSARSMLKSGFRTYTYTMVWNTLNYTACAFPVTTIDPVQDVPQPRTEFLSEVDKESHAACKSFMPPNVSAVT